LGIIEKSVTQNKKFIYTVISYSVVLVIFANLSSFQSPFIGVIAFIIYFLINSILLGNAFFQKENAFFRLALGVLSLIILTGFLGWLAMIIYNLDILRVILVLTIATTFSSILNSRMKTKNATG
jgi:hypothetical protein